MNITDLLAGVVAVVRHGPTPAAIGALVRHRHETVLIDDDGAMTGPQLWAAVTATAERWSAGIATPQRIGVICQQDRTFVIAVLAASLLGWDAVGLSPRQHDTRLRTLLERHHLTAVAGADSDRLRAICGDRTALMIIPTASPPPRQDRGRRYRRGPHYRRGRRGRVIMLSSGTTGTATASSRRRYGPGLARPVIGLWRLLQPTGRALMILAPLWHGYGLGMLFLALTGGVPVLITRHRTSADIASVAVRHRPRTVAVLPVQLDAMIERWPQRPDSIHRVITGSAPLSPSLCRRALTELGPRLINLYGSTESGWATWATPEDLQHSPGTVGRPAPGVRLMINDGEILVDSPLGTSARRPTPTGDRGHVDEHGCLMIDGRSDDIVIVNGNNVALSSVQRVLDHHPQVAWALVHADTDPIRGARLIADFRPRGRVDIAALGGELAGLLDWYAVPELRDVDESGPSAIGDNNR